jgi:hypothetical protein
MQKLTLASLVGVQKLLANGLTAASLLGMQKLTLCIAGRRAEAGTAVRHAEAVRV